MSFVPTFDYYLTDNNIHPYVGSGIGYYVLSDIDILRNGFLDILEVSVTNQIGLLLRGGFQSGKTRLGLECNFIPKAKIELLDNQKIGTVNASYFGMSIGFTIGGGKNLDV